MKTLVTGGAGYIGSHTVLRLLEEGGEVTVLDNLSNSSVTALERVSKITGRPVEFIQGDLCEPGVAAAAISRGRFDAVIHFAGLKAVGESTEQPLRYFHNNVGGTIALLDAMAAAGVKCFVFSSSATVYGVPETVPIREDAARWTTNPYGRSKLVVEDILADLHASDPGWRIARLRYFNPAGAHDSGMIGEDPKGIPNNLMPYITQVAAGRRESLSVFGSDYPTPDGTGVRDYIHVMDLAEGHLAALRYLSDKPGGELLSVNLGTGCGYSVLDMVHAFERVTGREVPYRLVARRPGDVAACYADPSFAERTMGWKATRDLDAMCRDAWHWQSKNPDGYGS